MPKKFVIYAFSAMLTCVSCGNSPNNNNYSGGYNYSNNNSSISNSYSSGIYNSEYNDNNLNNTSSNSIYYNQSDIYDDNYYQSNSVSTYKYNYKVNDTYNYDISGLDNNGNSVYGNVDIDGNGGSGYIEDENGNEKYIDVEWVGYGQMEGTDEDGNYYEFEVE